MELIDSIKEYSPMLFDRKSKRNLLCLFFFFFNASLANSFVSYNQLGSNELSYLNYLVFAAKYRCSGADRTNLGRSASEKKNESASGGYRSSKGGGAAIRKNTFADTLKIVWAYFFVRFCWEKSKILIRRRMRSPHRIPLNPPLKSAAPQSAGRFDRGMRLFACQGNPKEMCLL